MAERKTKSRLTMATPVIGNDAYASYFVIESTGDFSSTILEGAVEANLPQYNLNPPFVILGEDVPISQPIAEPTEHAAGVLKANG